MKYQNPILEKQMLDKHLNQYPGLILGLRPCSQRETSLQSNVVSHWLGANLESALNSFCVSIVDIKHICDVPCAELGSNKDGKVKV